MGARPQLGLRKCVRLLAAGRVCQPVAGHADILLHPVPLQPERRLVVGGLS
jgi:hypothetical protein